MKEIKTILAVGIGGLLGAVGRYGLSLVIPVSLNLPLATLTTNLIGCFLLSYLLFSFYRWQGIPVWLRTGLTTGIIGSFTTFSTVMIEVYDLGQGRMALALLYLSLSLFGGLLFSYLGYRLAPKDD